MKNKNGITLIALVITIIILLILAMITIRILMNQGIIRHTQNATEEYKISEEEEKITLGYQNYKLDKTASGTATLTVDGAQVTGNEANGWNINFNDTGNSYTLSPNGVITYNGKQESVAGISLNKNTMVLQFEEGETATDTLTATLTDISGTITWSIANTDVATISSTTGNEITVTSVDEGTTTVTATCGGSTAECVIKVYPALPIGEYVQYDCYTGVNSSLLSYTSPTTKSGYEDNQSFTVTANPKWKILGRDDEGHILIMAADSVKTTENKRFFIYGRLGYVNGPDEFDTISRLFSHGTNAIAGRSMRVADVNKICNYTPDAPVNVTYSKEEDGYIYKDGTKSPAGSTICNYYDEATETWKSLDTGESVTVPRNYYGYTISTSPLYYGTTVTDTPDKMMLIYDDDNSTDAMYWLADRDIMCGADKILYHVRAVYLGCVNDYVAHLYESNDANTFSMNAGIRPVITLSSDVKLGEKVNNVWQVVPVNGN